MELVISVTLFDGDRTMAERMACFGGQFDDLFLPDYGPAAQKLVAAVRQEAEELVLEWQASADGQGNKEA